MKRRKPANCVSSSLRLTRYLDYRLRRAVQEWQECSQKEREKVTQLLVDHRAIAQDRFVKAGKEPSEEFGAFDSARRILWALIYQADFDRRMKARTTRARKVRAA